MKKKFLSLILAALMVMPFAVFANAAETITVPAEPTLTNTTAVGYYAHPASIVYDDGSKPTDSNNGKSWDKAKSTWGGFGDVGALSLVPSGGTIVSVARAYIGTAYTFQKATSPILITAVVGSEDYRSNEIYNEDKSGNGSQRGTFIGDKNKTITFAGDYIFDDIDILVRGASFTMSVADGANLVIADGVEFCNMAEANIDNYATNSVNPTLNVDKGGYAFLHQVGFSAYTGEGTIIIDKALVDGGKITADAFASFKGIVADETGAVIVNNVVVEEETTAPETTEKVEDTTDKADETTKKAEETTKKADETTKKADSTTAADTTKTDEADNNNTIVWIIVAVAAVAVVAVVIVVVVKKKKAE